MKCTCGFDFMTARLTKGKDAYESYAIVNDKHYRRFLRAELKALQAPDSAAKLDAIARSAKYVGTVMKCPRCSRIQIADPAGKLSGFYSKAKESRRA